MKVIALLLLAFNVHAGVLEEGQAIAIEKTCATSACHGISGKSLLPKTPNLAGLSAKYISKQMREFRELSGPRPSTMTAFALTVTDEEVVKIAQYYQSLKREPVILSETDERFELGRSIYRGGVPHAGIAPCMGCHGPSGAGIPGSNYPRLSGQKYGYMIEQLQKFQTGIRHNDLNQEMRLNVKRMTGEEMRAVAYFIQGLNQTNIDTLRIR